MSDGWRVALPRVGVSRAGHGIFWVGVCFCLGIAVITAAFLILPHVGSTHGNVYTPPSHQPMSPIAFVGLGFFWLAGIGTVLSGMNMGLRRGSIEVTADVVRIRHTSLFFNRLVELPRSRIVAVQGGPSGLSVGGRRRTAGFGVDELHVYTEDGVRLRFFTGRMTNELDSLAQYLRETLGVGTKPYDGT